MQLLSISELRKKAFFIDEIWRDTEDLNQSHHGIGADFLGTPPLDEVDENEEEIEKIGVNEKRQNPIFDIFGSGISTEVLKYVEKGLLISLSSLTHFVS
jgi:hypothetical protein